MPQSAAPRHHGSEVTNYLNDPLKGDARAHVIAKKLRQGWTERKIAKFTGVPLEEVKRIAALLAE